MADNRLDLTIRVEKDQAVSGIKEVETAIGGLAQNAAGAVGGLTSTFGSLIQSLASSSVAMAALATAGVSALGALGTQAFDLVKEMGALAEEAGNLGTRLGVSGKQALELSGMAEIAGVHVGSLAGAARYLSDALEGSGAEGKKTYLALQQLGVSLKDAYGRYREMGPVLLDTIENLSKIENTTTRTHLANQILGKGAKEIAPLVDQYRDLRDTVRELYGGIDENLLKRLQKADDEINKLGVAWRAFKLALADKIEPIIIPVIMKLTEVVSGKESAYDKESRAYWDKVRADSQWATDPEDFMRAQAAKTVQQRSQAYMHGIAELGLEMSIKPDADRTFGKDKAPKAPKTDPDLKRAYELLKQYWWVTENSSPESPANLVKLDKSGDQLEALRERQREKDFRDSIAQQDKVLEYQLDSARKYFGFQDDLAKQARDNELREAEGLGAITLEQKLALEQKKLEIEKNYMLQAFESKVKLLEVEKEIELAKAGENAELKKAIEERYGLLGSQLMQTTEDAMRAREQDAANRSAQLARDAYMHRFNELKDSAGRVFDALLTRTSSFADAVKNMLKVAFLTPIRDFVSNWTAALLMGGRVGGGSTVAMGGAGSGGWQGLLGGMLPGLGPGGTPPFWGGIPGNWGGTPGGTPPFIPGGSGSTGGFGGFGGLFSGGKSWLESLGNLGYGHNLGTEAASYSGFGGLTGGAMLAGGGALAFDGWRRGGWGGFAELTGGGALIGAKFGGPLGALIGGAAGAIAGLFRLRMKSPEQKLIDEVRAQYNVTIDKDFARVLYEQVKGQDLRLALKTPAIHEQIAAYAMMTNQTMSVWDNVARGVNLVQSGGSLYQGAIYAGGSAYGYASSLQSFTAGMGTLGAAPVVIQNVTLQVGEASAADLLEGRVASVIQENPRQIQAAAAAAQSSSFDRRSSAARFLDPALIYG